MATYVQRIHLNRPINTRLIIAVRFVVTAAVSSASSCVDAAAGTHGAAVAFPHLVASQEQGLHVASREAATVGVRGTVAMRLRVVDPKDASTMKEYHHAESLPA